MLHKWRKKFIIQSKNIFNKKSSIIFTFLVIFGLFGLFFLYFSNASTPKSRGDLNSDSKINILDLSLLLSKYNTSYAPVDINSDGKVSIFDLSILLSNYGKSIIIEPAPWHIIYLSKLVPEANAIAEYKIMESNPYVVPSFRTDSVSESQKWESKGYNYYYMAASSDYTVCSGTPNPYMSTPVVTGTLDGKYNQGIYFHELGAVYACAAKDWNWSNAIDRINWPLLDSWVKYAKSKGKKVVWAEPAAGWSALTQHAKADGYLRSWGSTIVPIFATNFSHAPTNKVPEARAGALAAALKYNIEFGESIQSWYWIDPNWPYTSQDAKILAEYGKAAGATYFEIEGTSGDMSPGTKYMNGVNSFISELRPVVTPKQSGSTAPLPTYQ